MEKTRGDWPGKRAVGYGTSVEGDLSALLLARLEDEGPKQALSRLREQGCDDDRLFELLIRIYRSTAWEKISRRDTAKAVRELRSAQSQLRTLKHSELGRRIFDDELAIADQLIAELDWVIAGTEAHEARANRWYTPRTDSAYGNLIRYVKETTGQYRDGDVAVLITAAENASDESGDEMMNEDSLRQWRRRNGLASD